MEVKAVQTKVFARFKYRISYGKAWRAKHAALERRYHRSAMPESFDAYTEREEETMQHPHSWELWHEHVLDIAV